MGPKTERFEMRLDRQLLDRVDSWRAEQPDLPSRAEAMRRLVADKLALEGQDVAPFSGGERLAVLLLCHLIDPSSTEYEIDPKFILEAISRGHYWALDWEYPGLFEGEVDQPHVLREVIDMLEMWYFMESGYQKLSEQERGLVEREGAPFGKSVRFPGFDGNYETERLSIAKFLVNRLGRFDRFKGRDLNSHVPLTDAYRRMHPVFESMRWSLTAGGELSCSDIIALLQAMRHPEPPAES